MEPDPPHASRTRKGGRETAVPAARAAVIEPIDPRLLRAPLDFLMAEHYRLRAVLNHLDWLARAPVDEAWRRVATAVLAYLGDDLVRHGADEEETLFPLLSARCPDEAGIAPILSVLASEHESDDVLATAVRATLEARLAGPPGVPGANVQIAIKAFTTTQRRHLAWENAVVLPLARHHLTDADLCTLGVRMARRRGISLEPGERGVPALRDPGPASDHG